MTKQRRRLYLLWGLYFIIVIGYIALVWTQPIFDKLQPNILTLPFSEFNVVLVQFLIAGGMCFLFITDQNLYKKENAKRERGEKVDY